MQVLCAVGKELDANVFLCEVWSWLNNQKVDFPSKEKASIAIPPFFLAVEKTNNNKKVYLVQICCNRN